MIPITELMQTITLHGFEIVLENNQPKLKPTRCKAHIPADLMTLIKGRRGEIIEHLTQCPKQEPIATHETPTQWVRCIVCRASVDKQLIRETVGILGLCPHGASLSKRKCPMMPRQSDRRYEPN